MLLCNTNIPNPLEGSHPSSDVVQTPLYENASFCCFCHCNKLAFQPAELNGKAKAGHKLQSIRFKDECLELYTRVVSTGLMLLSVLLTHQPLGGDPLHRVPQDKRSSRIK